MSAGMILSNRKKPKNQIFFGLFLAFSLLIFYFFLYESNDFKAYPYLSVSCLASVFLIGPMLYFLAQYSVDKNFILTLKELCHILPAIIALITGLICVKILGIEDIHIYHNFFENRLVLILGFLGDTSFSIYLFISGKKLINKYLWNLHTLKNEPAALTSMIIFCIFILAAIFDILSVIINSYLLLQVCILLMSVCVIVLFFLNLIYPNFEISINDVITREKHRRSYLSNIDSENLKNTLHELLYNKETYKDEQLSLKKLALLTNVSVHQLSEFINTHYNKNYSIYINEFRIKKAEKLLLEKPEFTVLAIAYEVGFKSKSSFNDAFLKITGTTPSQFKKKHL
jgi:AraC-like DNA-binding protein